MSRILPLFPFVAALSLLACQNNGPVADGASNDTDDIVRDASATGLAAPANSAAAEAVARKALPPMSAGMAWVLAADGRSARFGPPAAPPQLTLDCIASRLVVTRHHPASKGATATLSVTGGGHAASLPVAAVPTTIGPGEAEWQGSVEGDMARAIERPFATPGQVEISLGGAPSLVVPAGAAPRRVLARCLAG